MNTAQSSFQSDSLWLSVIIPIYNAKKYLDRCVDSILRQSFRDFELLLIDDGSTDKSYEICSRYAATDSRVRCYRKENSGCLQSRFFGLERIRGRYFTFCDADDDYLTPDAFQIIHDKMEANPCDALQFGYLKAFRHLTYPAEGNVSADCVCRQAAFTQQEYPRLLCTKWDHARLYINVWSKVYNRKLLQKLTPDAVTETLFHGEDQVLNLFLLENCESFLFLADTLYAYRQTNSGTRRFAKNAMRDLDQVKAIQLHFLERWDGQGNLLSIQRQIFIELTEKLLDFAILGERALKSEDLMSLLADSLNLPRFQMARQYFKQHPETTPSVQMALFLAADVDSYVKHAHSVNQSHKAQKAVKWFVRRIRAII